jgi:hypothetical protein
MPPVVHSHAISLPTGELIRSRSLNLPENAPQSAEDPTAIRMVISTEAPVRTAIMVDGEEQQWDEILEHRTGADGISNIDTSAMRAILFHHDPTWILGNVKSCRTVRGELEVEGNLSPDALLPSNVRAIDAKNGGALRGTSLKYTYRADDPESVTPDFETRTLRVHKWRALEATLTAIPADATAGVRTLSRSIQGNVMTPEEIAAKAKADAAIETAKLRAVEEAKLAAETAVKARAAEIKEITLAAESFGLRASDFTDVTPAEANKKILAALAKRDADEGAKPNGAVRSHITVGDEHQEKVAKKIQGALLHNIGFRAENGGKELTHVFSDKTKLADLQQANDFRGMSLTEIARESLESLGCATRGMRKEHLAKFILGRNQDRMELMNDGYRDAANVSLGYFQTFVFLNVIKKAIAMGFSMGADSIQYAPLVARNYVPDYKQFAIGSLGLANLQETVENAAFPELIKGEGVYLDQIKMYGGTLSLSEQAIVSDDTGRFMEGLRQAGLLAQKTRDKRAFQVLMRGISTSDATSTWTDNTTVGTIVAATNDEVVAARVNMAKVEAALMTKIGQDGNPTGNRAKFLVVPPQLAPAAVGMMGIAPGMQNQTNFRWQVVESPWLQFSGLTGYSVSNYYLVSDPNAATGLVLSTLQGVDEPRVEQYDPGAVAAYKWKIYDPFTVGMGQQAVASTGKTIIAGIQQGTAS